MIGKILAQIVRHFEQTKLLKTMNSRLIRTGVCFILPILALTYGIRLSQAAPSPETMDIVSKPYQASKLALGDSGDVQFSTDGRYAAFVSGANNLTPNSQNGLTLDIFVRDLQNKSNVIISIANDGSVANGHSLDHSISADGRLVLFSSDASNLVPDDTNNAPDVFLRDWPNAKMELISVASGGESGNSSSGAAVFTPDGRFVVFESAASNLVSGDNNNGVDLFLRDRSKKETTLLTRTFNGSGSVLGAPRDSGNYLASICDDGRFVAYVSRGSNLVAGAMNGMSQIYLHNTENHTNILITTGTGGKPGTKDSDQPVFSGNGAFVAFLSMADNLVPGAVTPNTFYLYLYDVTAGQITRVAPPKTSPISFGEIILSKDGSKLAYTFNDQIYIYDTAAKTSTLITKNANGLAVVGFSDSISFSDDGKRLAFLSSGQGLVETPSSAAEVYVADTQIGEITLVSLNAAGDDPSEEDSLFPQISGDGRFVGFVANDSDLVEPDNNSAQDVFLGDATGKTAPILISVPDPNAASISADGLSTASQNAITRNGRYIVFSSLANDLVPNDDNLQRDIFLRDLQENSTILINGDAAGNPPETDSSFDPVISGDGRFIAFTSRAALSPLDTNGVEDIYVRDTQNKSTALISVNKDGTAAGNRASTLPRISNDGRYVSFLSSATDLVPNDANNVTDAFVRDMQTGTTILAGKATVAPLLSPSGKYVIVQDVTKSSLFDINARQIIPVSASTWAATGSFSDDDKFLPFIIGSPTPPTALTIFDPTTAETETVIQTDAIASSAVLSPDARYVAYEKIIHTDAAPQYQLTIHDRSNGSDVSVTDPSPLHVRRSPAFSADGKFLVFSTLNVESGVGDTNPLSDIFVFDVVQQKLKLVSAAAAESDSPASSSSPSISADGSVIVFTSGADSLVPNDLNNFPDVFVYHQGAASGVELKASLNNQGKLVVSWPSTTGKQYQLQSTATLGGTWSDVGGPQSSENGFSILIDPTTNTQQFYRVKEL
jgi:hypothetical protein